MEKGGRLTALPINHLACCLPAPVNNADDLPRAAIDLKQTVSVLPINEAVVVLVPIIIIAIVVAAHLFGLSGGQAAIILFG